LLATRQFSHDPILLTLNNLYGILGTCSNQISLLLLKASVPPCCHPWKVKDSCGSRQSRG